MRMLSIIQVTAGEKSDCAIAPSELRGEALRKTVLYRLELLSIQQFVAQKKSSARAAQVRKKRTIEKKSLLW